jgi:hypothetical protein
MNDAQLRRYTDLPALLYLLINKKLTLLDPTSWDDKNDAYYIEVYRDKEKLATALALCFSEKNETYHHWSVFTSRENGICIVFDRDKLTASLSKRAGIIHGPVKYKTLSRMRKKSSDLKDLPFLKRYAFKDESEYRVIYTSKQRVVKTKNISIPLSCIKKISVNPWAPKQFFNVIRDIIREIDGCSSIPIVKSLLINNKEWMQLAHKTV